MKAGAVALGAASLLAAPASAQVVVLAHPQSGDYVIVTNRASPRVVAMQQANKKGRAGGWKPLLASTLPGFGAIFCFRPKGGDVRYFVTVGLPSVREAISEARRQAAQAASASGATAYICGGPWENRNLYPIEAQAPATDNAATGDAAKGRIGDQSGPGLIDALKEEVRGNVTCDSTLPPVSARGLARENADPKLPRTEHDKMDRRGSDGRAPCVVEDKSQMGVRG
jgi:hypothetical protein